MFQPEETWEAELLQPIWKRIANIMTLLLRIIMSSRSLYAFLRLADYC